MNRVMVTFRPSGQTAMVASGMTVTQAVAQAGLAIEAPCAGRGACGRCRVRCSGGLDAPGIAEAQLLGREALSKGIRLACLARLASDATVEILHPSMGASASGKKASLAAEAYLEPSPSVRKHCLRAAALRVDATQSMLDNLVYSVADAFPVEGAAQAALQQLAEGADPFTAVVTGDSIVAVEPGDTTGASYGIAIDLGTSMVAGYLVDLNTGHQLAVAAAANPQRAHGDDVISRIQYAAESREGLRRLQQQAIEAIRSAVEQLVADSQVERQTIYELTLVGNTAMIHLLLGINPASLALAPYQAVTTASGLLSARDMGIDINPSGQIYVLPSVAGYVGADTVGVILATGMHRSSRIRLAIDLGTNGELVLGSRERLLCCSTAAGPAFEGGRIRQGMCAGSGAIERVLWQDGPEVVVVDSVKPRGICGSGLVDAVAGMVRRRIINGSGRLLAPGGQFTLVEGDATEDGEPIVIAQQDIRELQLAKAAIRAGIEVLKGELGVRDRDIFEVLLAGAFGSYVDKESAAAIGLLPGVPLERVRAVGNAAGAGAKLALLDIGARKEVEKIARQTQHIELSARPDFQDLFVAAMGFPAA